VGPVLHQSETGARVNLAAISDFAITPVMDDSREDVPARLENSELLPNIRSSDHQSISN
jgi:hypothetical protein